jgi:hypothetical protein
MAAPKLELVYFTAKQFSPRFGDNFFTAVVENFEHVKALESCWGNYVVYLIAVSRGRYTWTMKRRFKEFEQFLAYLKEKYPRTTQPFPALPPKTYCSVTNDDNFLINRSKELQTFLDELLKTLHLEKALLDEKVIEFLDLLKTEIPGMSQYGSV